LCSQKIFPVYIPSGSNFRYAIYRPTYQHPSIFYGGPG